MPAKGLIGGAFPLVMIVLFLGAVGLMFGSVRGIDPALAQPDNLAGQSNLSTANVSSAAVTVCLPIVVRSWPPAPETPLLNIIDNADADNYYTVSWSWSQNATSFILEEANDASFSDARVVFEGSGAAWTVPGTGKTPGTCHYRVKARNQWADSAWSNVQYITIYPMFVGLSLRWDGEGYIRGDEYYNVGTHHTRDFTDLTALDTVRAHSFQWYDPNPQGWDSAEYDNFYSVSTGYLLASSLPSDPSWKWRYFGIVPYDTQFYNGQEAVIDGQVFTVSGPLQGYTAFGQPVQYWQLVNRDGFLYWDGGGDWTQRVH
ncbi:MAG: hypothetical protein JXM73_25130, partial [Anaerolineae bacterium]|nr:hypothetical protein [Anaerolineae bacterium]